MDEQTIVISFPSSITMNTSKFWKEKKNHSFRDELKSDKQNFTLSLMFWSDQHLSPSHILAFVYLSDSMIHTTYNFRTIFVFVKFILAHMVLQHLVFRRKTDVDTYLSIKLLQGSLRFVSNFCDFFYILLHLLFNFWEVTNSSFIWLTKNHKNMILH